jgi:hypothetical protein
MKEFRKIKVEIDLCSDPRLRDMFTLPDAGRKVKAFIEKHGIKLTRGPYQRGRGEITDIELTGTHLALKAFEEEFLLDSPHAYAAIFSSQENMTS